MEQSELMVRRIKEGTVIDHIDEGKGLQVLNALRIDGGDGSLITICLLYTSPSPRDGLLSRMPSSA